MQENWDKSHLSGQHYIDNWRRQSFYTADDKLTGMMV